MAEFAILVVLGVALAFTLSPFLVRRTGQSMSLSDTPLGRLEQRKETLLENIADLDFEFRMGKLAQPDYEQMRTRLKTQAAEVIEQVDLLGRAPSPTSTAQTRFCTECGSSLPVAAKFCPSCGTKVREA